MAQILWLFAAVLVTTTTASYLPPMPPSPQSTNSCYKKCKCNLYNTEVSCSTLNLPKFKTGNIIVFKIDQPTEPIFLEEAIFANLGLTKLNTISINNATIAKFNKDAFKNLKNLVTVSIKKSKIPDIHPNTLADLNELKILNLHGSTLGQFEHVKSDQLQELVLSNTNLRRPSDKNFDKFPGLIYLDLSQNQIKTVDTFVFANLKQLAEVHLENNQIDSLPDDLFKMNLDLNYLDLSGNPLGNFNLNVTSSLERLDLRSCKLSEVGNKISELKLLNLDLSDNYIVKLNSETFKDMGDLKHINLSHNSLKTLPKDLFAYNSKLKKIILDHNDLKELPQFVNNEGSFETYVFSCQNCRLEKLADDTFANFPGIIKLLLGNNNIETVTKVLQKLPALLDVDLSNNRITSIDKNAFVKNSALQNINLSSNPLINVSPQLFVNNRVLKKIILNSCHLQQLWGEPKNITLNSIEILYATDNNITQLTVDDLKITPEISFFDLKNNNLVCTQELRNAIIWLTQRDVKHPHSEDDDKTHLSFRSDFSSEFPEDHFKEWETLANQSCMDYYDDYYYDEDEDEEDEDEDDSDDTLTQDKIVVHKLIQPKVQKEQQNENKIVTENVINDEIVGFEDDNFEFKIAESGYVEHRYEQYSYLWPAFMFIFTALSVLIIAANVILLVLKKRGTLDLPRGNLPQIKIIPWNFSQKLKKHSCSVYQPLSEDMSGPKTPMINRYEQIPKMPPVHDSTP